MDSIPHFSPLLPVPEPRPLVTVVPLRAPKRLPKPPGRPVLGWMLLALTAFALACGAATLFG